MFKASSIIGSMIVVLCAIFIVAIISCSPSPSEPQSGTLTGRIILVNDSGNTADDPLDFAGITVSLYPIASMDTTLVRLNSRYPGIGVQISQQSEFDHRDLAPISSVSTAADGSFSMTEIPSGVYNIAIFKEGWGYRYRHNVTIQNGDNSLEEITQAGDSDIKLYRDIVLSGHYGTGFISLNSKHHVLVEENVVFLSGGSVSIEPGAVIRVSPGKRITFMGNVMMQGTSDSLITITSNDGIYNVNKTVPQSYDGVLFSNTAQIENDWVEYVNMRFSDSGFTFQTSGSVRHSKFNCDSGAIAGNSPQGTPIQLNVSNCVIKLNPLSPNYSLNFSSVSSVVVEKSIFLGGQFGVYGTNISGITISNNYLDCSNTGVYFTTQVETTITHNEFITGEIGIKTFLTIDSTIQYNNFTSKRALVYRSYQNMGVANYNNFYCSDYAIDWVTNTASLGNLPATNNWWNTTDLETIASLILDKSDYTPSTQGYDTFSYVDYLPYRISRQLNAGIQP